MNPMKSPATRMALLIGLAAAALAGQAPHGRQAPPPARPGGGPGLRGLAENPHFMARLYQIRVNRIQQTLGVSEDRAKLVAERWGRWDREHMDRGEQAGALRKQFNLILMGPEKEEEKNARLKPLLDQFVAIRTQQETGRKQFEEDIRAGLTTAQQVRLILVMEEIQQRLREILNDRQGR